MYYYTIKCQCANCGEPASVKVQKGKTVSQHFIESDRAMCHNCGCVMVPAL